MEYELTALADQDIINAILLEGQNLHYVLPCFWNTQLSEHSLSYNCFNNVNEFKYMLPNILQWSKKLSRKRFSLLPNFATQKIVSDIYYKNLK